MTDGREKPMNSIDFSVYLVYIMLMVRQRKQAEPYPPNIVRGQPFKEIAMSNITIPAAIVEARQAELSAVANGYGARIQYAQSLVDNSEGVLWFTDGVKMPPLIEAEKEEYYKGLKAIKYSNPSNAWKMVKKYCVEYATQIGLIAKEEKPATEADKADSASSGDARHTKSFSLRVLEDVGGIFKAGQRLDKEGTLTVKEKQCLTHLGSALSALGIDLATLK